MKITDYTIISDGLAGKVEEQVFLHLKEGWQPFGSLQVIFYGDGGEYESYSQPMVKYSKEQPHDSKG